MSSPFKSNDAGRAMSREMSHARRQFAAAFSAGQAPVLDRFGRALEVGTLVVWHPPQDMVFQVMAIDPVLDPNQAPGHVKVTLSITAPVVWGARQMAPDLIVVGKTKDGHTAMDATGAPVELSPLDANNVPSEDPGLPESPTGGASDHEPTP